MRIVTDSLPWRFIVPRPRFFRNIYVAHKIPEVKRQINRQAFLKFAEYVTFAVLSPALLIIGILYAILWALDSFLKPGRFPIIPPFDEWQREAVEEARAIVPFDDMKERLGENQPRILSKKDAV